MGQTRSKLRKQTIGLRSGYPYKALKRRKEVRLLMLQPGQRDDHICFTLGNFRLSNIPKYEAISYVWGDSTITETVFCAGRPVQITASLFTALRRMRLPGRERVLWADAICIDQLNLEERGRQVLLMPDIYRQAVRVLIWLGDMTEEYAALQRFFSTICEFQDALKRRFGESHDDLDNVYAAQLRDEGGPDFTAIDWDPLARLLRTCPWWRRKWVVQEVVMAKSAVILRGEGIEVDWDVFYGILQKTVMVESLMIHMQNNPDVMQPMRNLFILQTLRENDVVLPISQVIESTRGFVCSDPRDHIFALLSLAADVSDRGAAYPILPDYSKQAVEIFANFALGEIFDRHDLMVLSFAGRAGDDTGAFPSWVPDLTTVSPDARLASLLENFKAGGETTPEVQVTKDGKSLTLRGIVVGSVASFAPSLNDVPGRSIHAILGQSSREAMEVEAQFVEDADRKLRWLEGLQHFVMQRGTSFGDDQYETLDRCLRCELDLNYRRSGASMAHHLRNYERRLRHNAAGIVDPTARETTYNVVNDTEDDHIDDSLYEMFGFYEKVVTSLVSNRMLFFSDSGCLGMAPRSALEGDRICVVYGGQVPFVVRPTEDGSGYHLIGECYVHGIMDGEGLSMGDACHIVIA